MASERHLHSCQRKVFLSDTLSDLDFVERNATVYNEMVKLRDSFRQTLFTKGEFARYSIRSMNLTIFRNR